MEVAVQISNELEKRISDVFNIFDHHGDKTIDVRDVGTVLRFLGCVPTEQEIKDVIAATEAEDASGDVFLLKFLPYMTQALIEHKMAPAPPEKLFEAFRVLDPEQKGYLSKSYFKNLMMKEGEPFTQEEANIMMAVAVDPIARNIPYEFYMSQLTHRPAVSIYDVAESIATKNTAARGKSVETKRKSY